MLSLPRLSAPQPSAPRRSTARRMSRVAAVAAVAAGLLLPAACTGNVQPGEYGDKYEENFMLGCTGRNADGDVVADDGKPLAPTKQCECVYAGLVEKVPFDEAKAFEEQQSEAESGDDIEVPADIQRIIDGCAEPG